MRKVRYVYGITAALLINNNLTNIKPTTNQKGGGDAIDVTHFPHPPKSSHWAITLFVVPTAGADVLRS